MGCGKSSDGAKPVLVQSESTPTKGQSNFTTNRVAPERDENATKAEPNVTAKPSFKPMRFTDLLQVYRSPGREATLRLEYVYGYNCSSSTHNLFYLSASDIIIYPCGAVTVLLSVSSNTQRFLSGGEVHRANGHYGTVTAVAVSRERDLIATGEKSVLAVICLWKLPASEPIRVIEVEGGTKGTQMIAFCGDSKRFATVDWNEEQTLRVYEVRSGHQLFQALGKGGKILSLQWNPKTAAFVTVGPGHFLHWSLSQDFRYAASSVLPMDDPRTMVIVRFFPNGDCVTADNKGKVYHWKEMQLVAEYQILPVGHPITAMAVGEDTVLVAGDTNKIHVLNGLFAEQKTIITPGTPISIDFSLNGILCGTLDGAVVEFGRNGRTVLMDVHNQGEVSSVCMDPLRPGIILSAGTDNKVKAWDISHRRCVVSGIIEVSDKVTSATAIAGSSQGHIAIGHSDGHFTVRMNSYQLNNILAVGKSGQRPIVVMRFLADGMILAVGKESGAVLLYNAKDRYRLMQECSFHSCKIVSLDFSVSKMYLRSQDSSLHQLFWKVSTGKSASASSLRSESWTTDTTLRSPACEVQPLVCAKSPTANIFLQGTAHGLMEMHESEKGGPVGYKAHAAETTAVVWTEDGGCVITAGGSDLSLMQWRFA